MRRFLAAFIALVLMWGSIAPFITVTHDVQAGFVALETTSLHGGQTLPVTLAQPITSFVIASSNPEQLEYVFEARYKDTQTGLWAPWQEIHIDHDMAVPDDTKQFSQIIFTPQITELEVRLPQTSVVEAEFTHLELVTFAPSTKMGLGFEPLKAKALQDGLIVTREEWGADTKYLYWEEWEKEHNLLCETKSWYCGSNPAAEEAVRKKAKAVADAFPEDVKLEETITHVGDKELAWSVQKSAKVNKLFVHHTANLNVDQNKDGVINSVDEEIAIRGVYYYHSIVRGWGDIGYNFIVGPTGTIYEGRFGGDKTVAAHAVWRNISSIGVSAMGNFETETLGDNHRAGIAKSLGYLSKKYGLDPTGTTLFYGKTSATILGHRDSDEASTACPGKNIYSQLDTIRKLAKDAMNGINVSPSAPLGSTTSPSFTSSFSPLQNAVNFAPGETKTIKLTLTNTGTETWDSTTYLAIQNKTITGFRVLSGDQTPARAAMIDGVTPPGDSAVFSLTLQSRYQGFTGNISLLPIAGGKYAMRQFEVAVNMQKGTVAFSDGAATLNGLSHTFAEPVRGTVTLRNSGNVPWEKEGDAAAYIEIAASGADGKMHALPTQGVLPGNVAPGQTINIPFEVLAPLREGTFTLAFTLRLRGDANLFGTPLRAQTVVVHPGEQNRLKLEFNAMATPDFVTSIDTVGTYVMYVTNTGNTAWENLNMLEPDLHISASPQGLTVLRGVFDERVLEPGKTTAVRFPFQTGYTTSNTPATLSLHLAGKEFVRGITKTVTLQEKQVTGLLLNQTVFSTTALASIQVRNTGEVTWRSNMVRLALDADTSVMLTSDKDVAPGATATFQIRSDRISTAGNTAQIFLEGRPAGVTVGTITRRDAPTLPLDFGSRLMRYRLQ